jgi:hypothetical protein
MRGKMRSINVCLLVFVLQLSALSASAQMPPPPPPPPIPPELLNQASAVDDSAVAAAAASALVSPTKRALILEYLRISGRNPSFAPQMEQVIDLVKSQFPMMAKQIAPVTPAMVSRMTSQALPSTIKVPPLTSMQQKAMLEDAQEKFGKMVQRSGNILAHNQELPKIMEDTLVSVYDKYFSEQDLNEIIAFYHTPVGAKLSKQQPAIDKELMTLTMTRSMVPTGKVMRQVQEEEELFAPGTFTPPK